MYRQCRLTHYMGGKMYAWIPEEFAFAGEIFTIQDSDGWLVAEVFDGTKRRDELDYVYERGDMREMESE